MPGKVWVKLVKVLVTPPPKFQIWEMLPAEIEELLVKVKFGLQAFKDVVEMPIVGDGEMIKVFEVVAGQL